MRLTRKSLAVGLASVAIVATAGAAGAAHAVTFGPPTVTVPVVTAVTDTTVTLQWQIGAGGVQTGIQVYGVGVPTVSYSQVVSGTTLTVPGLADARPYYVRAYSLNASGVSSGWSATNLFYTKIVYGIGQVMVSTDATAPGNGTYSPRAMYTAQMGTEGPLGIGTGGVVRFTCTNVAFGCNVKLQAYASALSYRLYPRIDVLEQGPVTLTENHAEYGEGADNSGATDPLTGTATDVPVGYGDTFNFPGPNPPASSNGATYLNLPGAAGAGNHYDVFTTWIFSRA